MGRVARDPAGTSRPSPARTGQLPAVPDERLRPRARREAGAGPLPRLTSAITLVWAWWHVSYQYPARRSGPCRGAGNNGPERGHERLGLAASHHLDYQLQCADQVGVPAAVNGHSCQAAGRPDLRLPRADAGRSASGQVLHPGSCIVMHWEAGALCPIRGSPAFAPIAARPGTAAAVPIPSGAALLGPTLGSPPVQLPAPPRRRTPRLQCAGARTGPEATPDHL